MKDGSISSGYAPIFFMPFSMLLLTYCIHLGMMYNGDNMDICDVFSMNLKMYRKNLGLSQTSFAEKAGLHRTYISAVECGKRSISLENIQKIADALEIDTYLLFIDNSVSHNNMKKGGNSSCHA